MAADCPYCGPHTADVHEAAAWYHPETMKNHAIGPQYDQLELFDPQFNDRRK
jgi:hypothetical protein